MQTYLMDSPMSDNNSYHNKASTAEGREAFRTDTLRCHLTIEILLLIDIPLLGRASVYICPATIGTYIEYSIKLKYG